MYGLLLGALAIEKSRSAVRAGEKLLQESQVVSTVIIHGRLRGMSSAAALDPHQRSIMQQLSTIRCGLDSGFRGSPVGIPECSHSICLRHGQEGTISLRSLPLICCRG